MKTKLLEILKRNKQSLEKIKMEKPEINTDNIEIIIENHCELFQNEEEIILQNAKILLNNNVANSLEEAIIIFAVMFRGLKKGPIIKENGKTIITFKESAFKRKLEK